MSRYHKELFLLVILPTLVTGSFLFWFVSTTSGVRHFTIAMGVLSLLILTTSFTCRQIRNRYIDPVIQLNQQLEEPDLMLTADDFADGTPVQALASTLAGKNYQLQNSFQEQLLAADSTRGHLQQAIAQLEEENKTIRGSLNQLQTSKQLELSWVQTLISLSETPLSSMIGYVNQVSQPLQKKVDVQQLYSSLAGLESAGRQIVFLTRELQQYSYARTQPQQFNLHQIVDDVLASLNPILDEDEISLLPVFDEKCAFEFEGKADLIKATLFNFVLCEFLDHENKKNGQTLVLHVTFNEDQRLIFGLSPLTQKIRPQPGLPRLQELLLFLDAEINNTQLLIPVTSTLIPGKRVDPGGIAKVVGQTPDQQRSIESRLRNLGIEVIDNNTGISICVIGYAEHEDIKRVTDQLDPQTHVLLLNNSTVYTRTNWYQLRHPLDHDQLIRTIRELRHKPAHSRRLLLVDDYEANLHLLTLILEELGHSVVAVNNPTDAITRARREQFDLIFMDIQMPEISGMDASKTIREQGFIGIIIALTAHLSDREKAEIVQFGINDTLLKPVNKMTLETIIDRWAGGEPQDAEDINEPDTRKADTENTLDELIFSEELALQRANFRPDLAAELMQLLIESLPDDLANMNSTYSSKDGSGFRRQVHRIHGAIQYCGVPRLGKAIRDLETLAKQDHSLQSDATRQALDVSNDEIHALCSWYESTEFPFEETV